MYFFYDNRFYVLARRKGEPLSMVVNVFPWSQKILSFSLYQKRDTRIPLSLSSFFFHILSFEN